LQKKQTKASDPCFVKNLYDTRMMPFMVARRIAGFGFLTVLLASTLEPRGDQVKVSEGVLQGTTNGDGTVRMFKGVPFAAPPVGDLRWAATQLAPTWSGIRHADKFGSASLQTKVFDDILFRDAQPNEDCLNLDMWYLQRPKARSCRCFSR
jgi:hypothetical protein